MKKLFTLIVLFCLAGGSLLFAQVGINATGASPDASAGLDVSYADKGFLPPRLTVAQRQAIVNPAVGLQIYNTDLNCLEYYNGSDWYNLCGVLSCNTAPAQPSAITGDAAVCQNTAGFIYSVPELAGETYTWTFPAGWVITAGQGTASVTVNSSSTSGTISVAPANACGTGTSQTLAVSIFSSITASGGNEISSGGYRIHTFTSSGSFVVSSCMGGNVEVLVVAGGGGGGGFNGGGGGGAGGLVYAASYAVSAGATIPVTVGNGGSGSNNDNGANGENSVFDAIIAIGGGGGGRSSGGSMPQAGGSGGGPGRDGGGNQTAGLQGNSGGGIGYGNASGALLGNGGAGGGGAGGVGGNATGDPNTTGVGGPGLEFTQFAHAGSPAGWFAGGGGGSIYNSSYNAGGAGGGGDGSSNTGVPASANAVPNTGGGGGGGSNQGWGISPGNGGSGIVIVRYPL